MRKETYSILLHNIRKTSYHLLHVHVLVDHVIVPMVVRCWREMCLKSTGSCGKEKWRETSENKYVLIKIEKGKRKGKVFVVNGNPCNVIRSCGLHYMLHGLP
jgi:hypothetical protein